MEQHQYSMGPFGAFPAYAAPQVAGYALPPQMEMMQQAPPMHLGHGLGVPPQAVPPPQPRPRAPKPSKKKPAKKKPAKKKPPKPKPKKKGPTKKELEKKRRAKEREKREKEKLKTKAGRKKRARDPAAPKRARTAFNFFLDDFRAEYKVRGINGERPGLSPRLLAISGQRPPDFPDSPYASCARAGAGPERTRGARSGTDPAAGAAAAEKTPGDQGGSRGDQVGVAEVENDDGQGKAKVRGHGGRGAG